MPDLTVSELAANSLTTSSESFADNDTTLMTSAAINDRIESFGYSTTTGTVTSVGTTGTVNGITLTGTVTGSGDLTLGGTLANITVSQLAGSALTTSSESFADNDTTLMTSAAINDRITSFGYITSVPAQSFSSLTGKPTTISGYGITDAFDGAYSSLTGTPTIPSNTNQLTNGAGFITSTVTGTLTTDAIRFGDSHVKRISVDYRGSDYLVDNEYQKILTITPTNSSRNYSIIGRIMATSGSYVHTLDINVALRTNTLPDLSYSGTYTSTITGTTEYLTPRMWVKETTTAGFELVIEVNAQIYGRLNADLEIITREEADLATVVVNTIEDSEVTSVTTGFTQYNLTKVFETDDGVFALTNGVLDLKNTGSQSEVRLYCESSNAYYASLKAPAHVDISSNVTLTLPATTSTLLSTASNLSDLANVATTSPSSGEVLKWNGSAWSPAADAGGSSGLSNVVEDTTPQLGGTLDTANQLIQFGDSSGATVNRLQIGTGQDLSLYHDGTNSYITHNNVVTSSLILQNINTDSNSTDGIRIETIDNTASGLDNYVHLPNNAGVRLGVSGIDRVSVLTSASFFNHDIVLNGSSHELKFRGGSYYTILDAVISDSQDHTVTLPASTGTVPVFTTAPTGAIADGTNGQVLSTDGAGTLSFTTVSGGSSGLSNLVEDTSPQLGGDLDTNGFQINMDDQKSIQFSSGSYYGFINYNSTFNPYGNSNGTMTVTAFGAPLRLTSSFENTYLGSQFSAVNIIETNNLATNTPLIVRTNTGSATDNLFKIDYQGTATFEKGVVDIKNSGSQSEVRLYCESANQHYAALKAPAHVDISSNVTLTLPATTSTLLSTASNLNDLANVSVGSPDNGYVLKYNSSESRWEAAPDATGSGGGGSATNADTVDNLHLSVVTSMPASPNSSTIYFVTG